MRPITCFLAGLVLAGLVYFIANPNIELDLTPVAGEPGTFEMTVRNRGVLPVLVQGWPAYRSRGFAKSGWGGCGTGRFGRWLAPGSSCVPYELTRDMPNMLAATEVGMHYMKVEEVYLPFVHDLWEYEPHTAWAEIPRLGY